MFIDFLLSTFKTNSEQKAVIWNEEFFNYSHLSEQYSNWNYYFNNSGIRNKVIVLRGDFTPNSISFLLAAIENSNIIIPMNFSLKDKEQEKRKINIAGAEYLFSFDAVDNFSSETLNLENNNAFYGYLKENNKPGLVLFTSGTSGEPKAAVHDFSKLLNKFVVPRKSLTTVNFLLFDHWGGLNTMFHTLSNAGIVLTLRERNPDAVCAYIEKFKIELLPASPTFFNLLLLSEAYKKYDLSSLKLVSYGTEPMPESTLARMNEILPGVKFQQTYGLIELGVLRSKSKDNKSLWVKLGGEGYDIRVVDNILQIKADSAMLGYLNAPSPFTEDGYFITGDWVEQDGEYLKILGRKSELINVGGEKVYPTEIESIIQEHPDVEDITIYSEKNPIMGNIVCAKVKLKDDTIDHKDFINKLRKYCRSRLPSYKIPVKIFIESGELFGSRFKKVRGGN